MSLLIVISKEGIKINEAALENFLKRFGIDILGDYFEHDKCMDNKEFMQQIKLIVKLHKRLINCDFEYLNGINSTIGKNIENFKVQIKRLKFNYYKVLDKKIPNKVDKVILSEGKNMLEQGEYALQCLDKIGYEKIIERSMNRQEVCLGRVDEGNLKFYDNNIQIGKVKALSYNLVEDDLYSYIKRIQKKQISIDEDEIIRFFVHESHLSANSIDYLRVLCTYPKEFLKTWDRYIENKRNKTLEEYTKEFNKAIKYENKYFI